MNIGFQIFHESPKPANAERAIRAMRNGTKAQFDILKVEPYLHKGCVATCEFTLSQKRWEDVVIEALKFAQKFGYGWGISGKIERELDLTTTRFSHGSGVTMVHIHIKQEWLVENQ